MAALVVRGLAARKMRAALTAIAVLLGVAMIAGSYVLTDTINTSFDKIFAQGEAKVDVEVTPHEIVKQEQSQPPAFPQSYLERVKRVPGANIVAGGIFDQVSLIGKNGKPLVVHGGAPNFADTR